MIPTKIKEYIDKKIFLTSKPTILNIEVTNVCNLNCPICSNRLATSKGFMSLEFLDKLINKNRSLLNSQTIWLHFGGEPLLHPRLSEIIKKLKDNNIRTRLSTNATLLTKEVSYKIMSAGLDYIVFSVDGNNKDSYENIRVGANFEKVVQNILDFLEVKKINNFGTKTQIQFIKTRLNKNETKQFIKRWMSTDIDCVNIKSLSNRAGKVDLTDFLRKKKHFKKNNFEPCFYLWDTLLVLWNGKVIPCCQDLLGDSVVGDANIDTLENIWNSAEIQRLRRDHINHKFSGACANCFDKKCLSGNYISYFFGRFYKNFLEKLTGRMIKDEGINIIFNKNRN